ncbi:diaminopimelate epimerase [Nocardia sp. NPDC048505]|uniref:diaminopimelate epimerase n=1 Tax=unclassified Nocardia TaxID=2637762 RepID=UPI0033FBF467
MTRFTKMQALGNDYLVIEPAPRDATMDAARVRRLCDRHFGIGADGILLGPTRPVADPQAAIGLRIFNSDGTECEKSGNGLRMFAAYLRRHHLAADEFVIDVPAGECAIRILGTDPWDVAVDMGKAQPLGETRLVTPDGADFVFHRVDLGNPHAVTFVPEPTADFARTLGPWTAHHSAFDSAGTNVQLCAVLDRRTVRLEIWERGAGYTLASGSSACAAAYAACHAGYVEEEVTVRMPGGTVAVSLRGDRVNLRGGCAFIAEGRAIDG